MDANHSYSRQSLAEQIKATLELTRQSAQVLKDNPKPDTFAGRKTQEPFPFEDKHAAMGYLNSRELQPPD
jgi:hypothetical protein